MGKYSAHLINTWSTLKFIFSWVNLWKLKVNTSVSEGILKESHTLLIIWHNLKAKIMVVIFICIFSFYFENFLDLQSRNFYSSSRLTNCLLCYFQFYFGIINIIIIIIVIIDDHPRISSRCHTIFPLYHKYFSVYLLRIRIFSLFSYTTMVKYQI